MNDLATILAGPLQQPTVVPQAAVPPGYKLVVDPAQYTPPTGYKLVPAVPEK